jgi:hypothetical protein
MAERIQRRRVAGWKMPEGAVYAGRPTLLGNPWVIDKRTGLVVGPGVYVTADSEASLGLAVALHRDWIRLGEQAPALRCGRYPALMEQRTAVIAKLPDLRGCDLVCWCRLGGPCHVNVLLELANRMEI